MIVIYLLNCVKGNRVNDTYAAKFLNQCKEFLEKNYAHIGINEEYSNSTCPLLL